MATKQGIKQPGSQAGAKAEAKRSKRNMALAAAAIVVILIILATGFIYVTTFPAKPSTSATFSEFLKNFSSAPRAAILVTYYNGTTFSSSIGCATALIEQLVSNTQTHRNTTTLDFFVLNQTSCVYEPNGIGNNSTGNYTYTTPAACLNMTSSVPTIFISYNTTNATVITQGSIRLHGDASYLRQCGISAELSQS